MIIHMKTTLIIPDQLMRALKREAAARGETLSAVVADVIKRGLAKRESPTAAAPLPVHHMGRAKADVADRDALERAMESGKSNVRR
jgi:hypothetical protein